ncbi:MAG: hypothetical protein AB1384_13640 [Actinomycetota bacterium]
MYSEDEIERLYMGKPIEDESRHIYGGFVDLILFSDEETRKLFLDLPMMDRLINVPCEVGE